MIITWTKCLRAAFWSGSIGADCYEAQFKFGIRKCKPASAPHTRWAALARRRADKTWAYQFVLFVQNGTTSNYVGTFETFEAAKATAGELAGA